MIGLATARNLTQRKSDPQPTRLNPPLGGHKPRCTNPARAAIRRIWRLAQTGQAGQIASPKPVIRIETCILPCMVLPTTAKRTALWLLWENSQQLAAQPHQVLLAAHQVLLAAN